MDFRICLKRSFLFALVRSQDGPSETQDQPEGKVAPVLRHERPNEGGCGRDQHASQDRHLATEPDFECFASLAPTPVSLYVVRNSFGFPFCQRLGDKALRRYCGGKHCVRQKKMANMVAHQISQF